MEKQSGPANALMRTLSLDIARVTEAAAVAAAIFAAGAMRCRRTWQRPGRCGAS